MTNEERAQRGAHAINSRMDREDNLSPHEAAVDAITDILHAYCSGDELQAEDLLRTAKTHFVAECDEATKDEPETSERDPLAKGDNESR